MLRRAQSQPGYMYTVVLRSVEGKSSPAAADFEHPVTRLELQFATDQIEFMQLSCFERIVFAEKQAARVEHSPVQKESVKIIAEVVVMVNVVPASTKRIGMQAVAHPRPETAQGRHQRMAGIEETHISDRQTH